MLEPRRLRQLALSLHDLLGEERAGMIPNLEATLDLQAEKEESNSNW